MTVYIDPQTGLQYDLPDVTGGVPDQPIGPGVPALPSNYVPVPPGIYTDINILPGGNLTLSGPAGTVPIAGNTATAIINTLQGMQTTNLPGITGEANIPLLTPTAQAQPFALQSLLDSLKALLGGFGAGAGLSLTTLLFIMAISGRRIDTRTILILMMLGGATGAGLSLGGINILQQGPAQPSSNPLATIYPTTGLGALPAAQMGFANWFKGVAGDIAAAFK